MPGADDGAAFQRRFVERAAEMRAHERVREQAALVLDHAEAVARDVDAQRQPRAERGEGPERERRPRAGLRGRGRSAAEQRLAAHHHRLVLVPEPRVEADVALAERRRALSGRPGTWKATDTSVCAASGVARRVTMSVPVPAPATVRVWYSRASRSMRTSIVSAVGFASAAARRGRASPTRRRLRA